VALVALVAPATLPRLPPFAARIMANAVVAALDFFFPVQLHGHAIDCVVYIL